MKTLIVLGGPTASGKTSLAIQWAQQLNTVILSADSRQCYKEMTIGVAKPTCSELALVPHYFINSHSIHEEFTAGEYERFGLSVLQDQFQNHDYIIAVGGTGLYLKALCEGIDEMPEVNPTIKEKVELGYKQNGLTWLQEHMQKDDPAMFMEMEQNNPARLMRALSFKWSTGLSIRTFQSKVIKQRDFNIKKFYINPERALLYANINHRVNVMMNDGLLEEVKDLICFKQLKNLQTVGYQEIIQYLESNWTLAEAIDKIKQHTRNYAKRQITWFRNQSDYQLVTTQDNNIFSLL